MDKMIEAMCVELEIKSGDWPFKEFNSVYFGGGTPSILPINLLTKLFNAIYLHFTVADSAEISLEANPDDINEENIRAWKYLGVNRLSIGLQSSHNDRLAWLNRIHSVEEGSRAVQLAQKEGIDNISLDLMYNFPNSTDSELEEDIDSLLSLNPRHISAYGLTIEENTVFGKRLKKGLLSVLPEDSAVRQFQLVNQKLGSAGFEGYEISNFGLPGFFAVHNTNYWFQKPYLAIGPGAHGFDGQLRTENYPNNALYIKSLIDERKLYQKVELLSKVDQTNEQILTRLRTKWGLNLGELFQKTGYDLKVLKIVQLRDFSNQGLIQLLDNHLFLTQEGKLLADHIAMKLMI